MEPSQDRDGQAPHCHLQGAAQDQDQSGLGRPRREERRPEEPLRQHAQEDRGSGGCGGRQYKILSGKLNVVVQKLFKYLYFEDFQ